MDKHRKPSHSLGFASGKLSVEFLTLYSLSGSRFSVVYTGVSKSPVPYTESKIFFFLKCAVHSSYFKHLLFWTDWYLEVIFLPFFILFSLKTIWCLKLSISSTFFWASRELEIINVNMLHGS